MNDTRNKILVSARELFTDYGYKKTSMDEIARNCGVTKKTVYSYFRDKDSLLNCLIEEEVLYMKSIIDKYSSDDSLSVFDFLNKTLYSLLMYKKESKLILRLNKEIDSSNIDASIKYIDSSIISFIKEKILMLRNRYDFDVEIDVDLCAFIIFKVYVSVMFEYDKEIDESLITNNVAQILKNGLFTK